jgi:hypothetical protein
MWLLAGALSLSATGPLVGTPLVGSVLLDALITAARVHGADTAG